MQTQNETEPPALHRISSQPVRMLYLMLRVANLEESLHFYIAMLGMSLLRRDEYPTGRFTLAFLGYQPEADSTVLELTHNWDQRDYDIGSGYGHLALAVADVYSTSENLCRAGAKQVRAPGPMRHRASDGRTDDIAFFEDPDGYRIELVQV